jgi:predicted Na+-dependent transporter
MYAPFVGSPVWTLGATALALARPQTFSWVSADLLTKSVMGVMLLVGLNLKTSDLKAAANQPKAVASGVGES